MPPTPHLPRPALGERTARVRARVAERTEQVAEVLSRPTLRARPDPAGWSAPELLAYVANPRMTPPRRAGHAAVRLANSLAGSLPVEALLLARAVADAAPPVGAALSPTLLDIVDRYLPDTLLAFRESAGVGIGPVMTGTASAAARGLLVDQLRLLYRVTADVQRAGAEHDERALLVQETFLRDRFTSSANTLDLPSPSPPARPPFPRSEPSSASGTSSTSSEPRSSGAPSRAGPSRVTPITVSTLAASSTPGAHHRLRVEHRPTALFTSSDESKRALNSTLVVRLALPRGIPVTLGAVRESTAGATTFLTARTKRWSARKRQDGFGARQVDVELEIPLQDTTRFLIHATSAPGGEVTEGVLFLTDGQTNSAELPTVLARRAKAATTVIASGYAVPEGVFVRNESLIFGSLQAACQGFGVSDVTWLSPDTPAV